MPTYMSYLFSAQFTYKKVYSLFLGPHLFKLGRLEQANENYTINSILTF